MKIEGYLRAGIVSVTILACFLLIYGNSIYEETYAIDSAPQFSTLNTSVDKIEIIKSTYENTTLLRYTEQGETDDSNNYDTDFLEYQARAFEGAGASLTAAASWTNVIRAFSAYVKVPPIILTAVITLIVLGIAFAFIAFWRGRRA